MIILPHNFNFFITIVNKSLFFVVVVVVVVVFLFFLYDCYGLFR